MRRWAVQKTRLAGGAESGVREMLRMTRQRREAQEEEEEAEEEAGEKGGRDGGRPGAREGDGGLFIYG